MPGGGDAFVKRAMAQWRDGTARTFCILVDHLEAGVIGLSEIDAGYRRAELGFWVARPYWNRGIMSEAVRIATAYAFEQFPIERVQADVYAWNPASARVLEKAGYTLEGRLRNAVYRDGKVTDRLIYGVIRGEVQRPD